MREKDTTEKTLESYDDVFADIVNVLFFYGKRTIDSEDLQNTLSRSIYKTGGKLSGANWCRREILWEST